MCVCVCVIVLEITIITLYEIIVIFYNLGKLRKLWLSFFSFLVSFGVIGLGVGVSLLS